MTRLWSETTKQKDYVLERKIKAYHAVLDKLCVTQGDNLEFQQIITQIKNEVDKSPATRIKEYESFLQGLYCARVWGAYGHDQAFTHCVLETSQRGGTIGMALLLYGCFWFVVNSIPFAIAFGGNASDREISSFLILTIAASIGSIVYEVINDPLSNELTAAKTRCIDFFAPSNNNNHQESIDQIKTEFGNLPLFPFYE